RPSRGRAGDSRQPAVEPDEPLELAEPDDPLDPDGPLEEDAPDPDDAGVDAALPEGLGAVEVVAAELAGSDAFFSESTPFLRASGGESVTYQPPPLRMNGAAARRRCTGPPQN